MASVERDDRGIWGKAAIAIPAIVVGGLLAGWLSNSGMIPNMPNFIRRRRGQSAC